jgi:hypothetical protein
MTEDFEAKYLREINLVEAMKIEIDELKKQVKKANSTCDKLSNKIKSLELQGLQDQIVSLNESLVDTQRSLAVFMIFHIGRYYIQIVERKKPEIIRPFSTQMVADTTSARVKAASSNDPLSISVEFSKKCGDRVEKLGIPLIDMPL